MCVFVLVLVFVCACESVSNHCFCFSLFRTICKTKCMNISAWNGLTLFFFCSFCCCYCIERASVQCIWLANRRLEKKKIKREKSKQISKAIEWGWISLPVADNWDVELLFLPIPVPNRSRSLVGVSLFGDRWFGFLRERSKPGIPRAVSLKLPSARGEKCHGMSICVQISSHTWRKNNEATTG